MLCVSHNSLIDTDNNNTNSLEEAEAYTGTIVVADAAISDFTGLEAFVNRTGLNSENAMAEIIDFGGAKSGTKDG